VPVTIKDIAKAAGVSHTTVSRALKNNPAISPETTENIRQLARDMGYVPSAVAQSLLSRRTYTVGMVVTTIADPFIVQVVEGAEQTAQKLGYSIFLSSSHNNPDQEMAVVEMFQRRRVDAIVVTSSRVGSLYSARLAQIQVPIVLINNQAEGEFLYSVAVDDLQGAQLAVEHLINLGHRHISYIGTTDRPKSNGRRLAGYITALSQAGINLNLTPMPSIPVTGDFELGQAALKLLLETGTTAVFCYNDRIAIGLLTACYQHHIAVPGQLSIVGFDDIELTLSVVPPLTTVHQPRLQLGQLAMQMVFDLLDGQDVQDQLLPCELVVRQTTAPISL
jgi:DNA-binding LacI/PurR family transcriptional regulator